VKYSTIEELRVIADTVRTATPFQTVVPITTSTRSLAFSLTWTGRQNRLRLAVHSAGKTGRRSISRLSLVVWLAPSRVIIAFSAAAIAQTAGDWTIRITADTGSVPAVPFDFSLLGDDAAINSALGPEKSEYAVGDAIKLTAQINDLDHALLGVGSQPNDRFRLRSCAPGKTSVTSCRILPQSGAKWARRFSYSGAAEVKGDPPGKPQCARSHQWRRDAARQRQRREWRRSGKRRNLFRAGAGGR